MPTKNNLPKNWLNMSELNKINLKILLVEHIPTEQKVYWTMSTKHDQLSSCSIDLLSYLNLNHKGEYRVGKESVS